MTRPEQRALARKRQHMVVAMRARGMSVGQIADAMALSGTRIRDILRADYREPIAAARPSPPRPYWSFPDDELLALAAVVRAEIIAAEGFERPLP